MNAGPLANGQPERDPLIKEPDPELERLLAEEERVERIERARAQISRELDRELRDAVHRWHLDSPLSPGLLEEVLAERLIEGCEVRVRYDVQLQDGRSFSGKIVDVGESAE